jgi:hypothetical protein
MSDDKISKAIVFLRGFRGAYEAHAAEIEQLQADHKRLETELTAALEREGELRRACSALANASQLNPNRLTREESTLPLCECGTFCWQARSGLPPKPSVQCRRGKEFSPKGNEISNFLRRLDADEKDAQIEGLQNALRLILPLAKGYSPPNQSEQAKKTCQSWIEAAERALKGEIRYLSDSEVDAMRGEVLNHDFMKDLGK